MTKLDEWIEKNVKQLILAGEISIRQCCACPVARWGCADEIKCERNLKLWAQAADKEGVQA